MMTITAYLSSVTNSTALPRKLKISPAKLPTIGNNVSTAFTASLLKACSSFFGRFFKILLSFGGDDPKAAVPSFLKTPALGCS